ncbi:hypothetical protein ACIBKY_51295 [Nonomuraea sp. NPDC050394]|uniref:hypothetical protein n=1 Tax=Nonomuraea sp. NPDC050394 TaxID=3364363 RepID=UPI00379812F6
MKAPVYEPIPQFLVRLYGPRQWVAVWPRTPCPACRIRVRRIRAVWAAEWKRPLDAIEIASDLPQRITSSLYVGLQAECAFARIRRNLVAAGRRRPW